ncbi:hypothetical protein [Rhodococcus koreensis]
MNDDRGMPMPLSLTTRKHERYRDGAASLDRPLVVPVPIRSSRDTHRTPNRGNGTVERIRKGATVSADIGNLISASGRDVLGVSSIIETSADLHAAEIARSAALADLRGDYLNALMP